MSLVAYGSSDDSDSEETSASQSKGSSSGGLFSLLPTPKKPVSAGGGSRKETRVHRSGGDSKAHDDPDQPPSKGGLISAFMPKPRKRTEPVKITAPQIQRRDVSTDPFHLTFRSSCDIDPVVIHDLCIYFQQSDSDEDDEPAKKKVQTQVRIPLTVCCSVLELATVTGIEEKV